MSPRWWSQPFAAEGGQTAQGIKRQLGRPSLPEYAVLVREAVQNSWDARIGDEITVRISLERLGRRAVAWRDLFANESLPGDNGKTLAKLNSDSWLLTVSDRGTKGLGGPIRANEAYSHDVEANFVQFLRNAGEPRDKALGGGTYGFGKGIFYRISEPGTILVDTLNDEENDNSRRLMGASLGEIFEDEDGFRFTGRHWWGQVTGEIPDPVMGDAAAGIADQLGLPGFADGRTGTDVVVVAPNLEIDDLEGDPERLMRRIRTYVYWHLWPKLGSTKRDPAIRFELTLDGETLEMPPISQIPVLREFAGSLDDIEAGEGEDFTMSTHRARFGVLGTMTTNYVIGMSLRSPTPVAREILEASPLRSDPAQPEPYRHICRMRPAELVVDYLAGEAMPDSNVGYVGVFRAAESVDEVFAEAEPPTHDAWETAALTGYARGIVTHSRVWIRDQCSALVAARTGGSPKIVQGLGRMSGRLGGILAAAGGTRATIEDTVGATRRTGGSSSSGPGLRFHRRSRVSVVGGEACVETAIEVPATLAGKADLVATAKVILARGRRESESEAPIGAERPEILGWLAEGADSITVPGDRLPADQVTAGTWRVRCTAIPDVSVDLNVRKEDR